MADAKPVVSLLVLSGVGLLWLGLDWVSTSPQVRGQRLTQIAREEAAQTVPPMRLLDQTRWLVEHRLTRLQGMSLLVGLGALMGLGEGLARRRRDLLVGMRLRTWTVGLMSAALAPGLIGGLVLCPLPWPQLVVAGVGAAWSGLTVFSLSRGVPYVP